MRKNIMLKKEILILKDILLEFRSDFKESNKDFFLHFLLSKFNNISLDNIISKNEDIDIKLLEYFDKNNSENNNFNLFNIRDKIFLVQIKTDKNIDFPYIAYLNIEISKLLLKYLDNNSYYYLLANIYIYLISLSNLEKYNQKHNHQKNLYILYHIDKNDSYEISTLIFNEELEDLFLTHFVQNEIKKDEFRNNFAYKYSGKNYIKNQNKDYSNSDIILDNIEYDNHNHLFGNLLDFNLTSSYEINNYEFMSYSVFIYMIFNSLDIFFSKNSQIKHNNHISEFDLRLNNYFIINNKANIDINCNLDKNDILFKLSNDTNISYDAILHINLLLNSSEENIEHIYQDIKINNIKNIIIFGFKQEISETLKRIILNNSKLFNIDTIYENNSLVEYFKKNNHIDIIIIHKDKLPIVNKIKALDKDITCILYDDSDKIYKIDEIKNIIQKYPIYNLISSNISHHLVARQITNIFPDNIIANDFLEEFNIYDNQINLLLIDDQKMNYLILQKILLNLNITIIYYSDPKEALKYIKVNYKKLDLIITDINMPEIKGYDLAYYVRKFEEDNNFDFKMPIIAYTGNDSDMAVKYIYANSITDLYFKGQNHDVILNVIKLHIILINREKYSKNILCRILPDNAITTIFDIDFNFSKLIKRKKYSRYLHIYNSNIHLNNFISDINYMSKKDVIRNINIYISLAEDTGLITVSNILKEMLNVTIKNERCKQELINLFSNVTNKSFYIIDILLNKFDTYDFAYNKSRDDFAINEIKKQLLK